MVGKMGETCPQCKQFRMLCMCAVTSDRDRKGRMGRRTSTEKALAFAQSLAVWRRSNRRNRSAMASVRTSREPSLRTGTNSPSLPPALTTTTISTPTKQANVHFQSQEQEEEKEEQEQEHDIEDSDCDDKLNEKEKTKEEANVESVVITMAEEAKLSDSFFYHSRRKRSITELGLNALGQHNFAMRQILNAKSAKQLLQQEINFEEELVAAVPSRRNWTGIAISLFVIFFVIGLIALAVVIMTPPDDGPRYPGRKITIHDLVSRHFKPRKFNGTWVSGNELLFQDASGGLTIFNFAENRTQFFMSNNTFRQLNSDEYSVSADLRYVLVGYEQQKYFQNKVTSKYKIFSLSTRSLIDFSLGPDHPERFQWVIWSTTGHSLVASADNDLYYVEDVSKPTSTSHRLTSTGEFNTIYNGIADRLYEEEILGQSQCVWFSPDSKRLLFSTFNDSNVGLVSFKEFDSNPGSMTRHFSDDHAPYDMSVRYSKTGSPIPQVSFTLVDLETKNQTSVQPPASIDNIDHYFTSVGWQNPDVVSIIWTNRLQNFSIVSLCQAPNFQCKEIYREEISDGRGWVDSVRKVPLFSHDLLSMITIRPVRDSSAGHFAQVVRVDIGPGHSSAAASSNAASLTHGKFEVTELVDWDEENHFIYYISTLSGLPGVRHLFRVQDVTEGSSTETTQCLTCKKTIDQDSEEVEESTSDSENVSHHQNHKKFECQYLKAHISPDKKFYILECKGPKHPTTSVFTLPDNKFFTWLDRNEDLAHSLKQVAMPKIRHLQIALPGTKIPAQVRLLLPPGFREYEEFKFPLLVHLYNGPGSQSVTSEWHFDWDTYMSSAKDFVVATADVRGSSGNGASFKHAVHRQIGAVETKDYIHIIKHLIEKIDYIDEERVSVWGHGYGGHLATRLLAEDKDRDITCAIAVAPIAKWQIHESYFTERLMGLPGHEGNWRGYEEADLTYKTPNLMGRDFFLIQGAGGDIVHFEQSMTLVKALVESNVLFRQQVYPFEDGNLVEIMSHLYSTMFDFLHSDCFLTQLFPLAKKESRFSVDQTYPVEEDNSAWTILQYWNS